ARISPATIAAARDIRRSWTRWKRWRRLGRKRSDERTANADAAARVDSRRLAAWQAPMRITDDSPPIVSALDRPNSYIGRSVPRPNLARLTQGRAQFVSDLVLPRMGHVAFVRSPHAHARILRIEREAAQQRPGVIAIVTGAELARVISPWIGVRTH